MAGSIVPTKSAGLFFWSLLRDEEIGLTDDATAYVVGLLVTFSHSDKVFAGAGQGKRPVMVDFLLRAQAAEPQERARIYRHVGDLALFTAGMFAESLFVSRSYYVSVGGGAYGSAASLAKKPTSAVMFEELSDRFEDVVDALSGSALC